MVRKDGDRGKVIRKLGKQTRLSIIGHIKLQMKPIVNPWTNIGPTKSEGELENSENEAYNKWIQVQIEQRITRSMANRKLLKYKSFQAIVAFINLNSLL